MYQYQESIVNKQKRGIFSLHYNGSNNNNAVAFYSQSGGDNYPIGNTIINPKRATYNEAIKHIGKQLKE